MPKLRFQSALILPRQGEAVPHISRGSRGMNSAVSVTQQIKAQSRNKNVAPGLVRILAQPRQPRAYQTFPVTTYLVAH
jgi:hypothetical protein